jgi:LysM repeat protein
MGVHKILAAFVLIAFTLGACQAIPMPTQATITPTTVDESIGTVSTVQTRVQAGPLDNLSNVPISQVLYSHDAVHVTEGGIALLNFLDQVALKLFNDTTVGGVNAEILETTNRRLHMKLERGGLSGQVVKGSNSGGVDFEIANGVHIYIVGTSFYITYDPATDIVSVGNFDGIVGYHVAGQSPQMLPAGSLVDILPGGIIQLFNMPFDIKSFDMAAQTSNSPIQGLKSLRGLPVTSPAPVSEITPTPTMAAGAVIYVPPISTATRIPPPVPCYHPAGWVTYVVQSGETMYQISLKFGATTAALQNGNCMGRSLLIYTGQVLYIPNVPPTILNVVLTPDTPQPGVTLIPTDIPAIEPTPTLPAPSFTPTPVDAPSYFNNPTASASSCTLSFSVSASDADGIEAVKVVYSINNVKSILAVMSQSQGVYTYSTSLTQNTAPSDVINYYFKVYDRLGHITESGKATIQADNCLP